MAAQVEVQTGEVGGTRAGGRLHLSPLTDASNKNVIEMPTVSLESNKPAPNPKPRLTPKPFAVEKNPTIKPILAPKPRPEPTRISGSKPDLSNTPKPTARLVSTNPDRPAATSFRTPNSLKTGQTTKPVIQPFKPVPPLDPVEPSKSSRPIPTVRQKPVASNLAYSKSLKTYSAAEWSGTTSVKNKSGESKEGSMTRAKSMEFLAATGHDEEAKNKSPPEAAVQLRTQPRRPRPVSAIFSAAPAKTETPVPAPRWAVRRPLSADLTSKFESIGLSLHQKSPKANTPPDQDQEQEKTPPSATSDTADSVADQTHSEQKAEETAAKDGEDVKPVASIKSRISLLLDASSSPGTAADPLSPVQPVPEAESSVDVKQLIKQLTVDTTSSPIPAVKPVLKPRPLPLDLTKKFSSERSPDPEAADRHDISKESQRGAEESTTTPNDHKTFLDFKGSPLESRKELPPEGSEAGLPWAHPKESGSGAKLHTVRASLFENIVERQSVFLMDQDESPKDGGVFFTRGNEEEVEEEEDGSLVTATYREPVSPSDPFRVSHAFDTIQAAEENRAVSESVPAAQWEDKAMTLRTRRSERARPAVQRADPSPRYLRVGALHKWTTTSFDQGEGSHKGISQESESEGQAGSEKDQDAAAPKRLKMLQGEEPQKLKATYFALTGHMQDTASLGEVGSSLAGANLHFNDLPVRSALGGSQGQIYSARRNPSLEEAFGQISPTQEKFDEVMQRNTVPSMEINSQMEEQTKADVMELKKTKEPQRRERHLDKMNEHEEQAQVDFERMKELERQREFERQRQKVFEKEKREREEMRQRQKLEMEKQTRQELERERQRQIQKEKREQERQKEMEMQQLVQLERQSLREKAEKEAEKLKQMALEQEVKELEKRAEQKEREMEMQRERELEKQRQREMEKEKKQQDLERQQLEKERLRKEQENKRKDELEKLKEMERQQLVELEKQRSRERAEKEAERLKQMALEQESLRIRELEKEKERQRELEIQMEKERELEKNRQKQLDMEREQLENERLKREQERKRKEEFERLKEMERQQLVELERQRLREKEEKEAEKLRQMALEQEVLKIKELEKERVKQRELEIEMREREKRRQREVEKEKQRQLDLEKQQFENERLRREQEKDRQRKELEMEKHKAKEKLEKVEAEKMRHIAKQQELERQRLKEKQKKEEQERLWLESSTLRPKVLDPDSVLRSDLLSLASPQHGDASPRWREPYKPVILDIDSFTSHAQGSPGKDSLPASGIPGLDAEFGVRLQPVAERDVSWKVPAQTSASFSSPVWTMSPQDPWELRPVEMSVDKPAMEPKRVSNKLSPELKQEQRNPSPQQHRPAFLDEPLFLSPLSGKEQQSRNSLHELSHSSFGEQIWIPREPQPPKERRDAHGHRRSHGSQVRETNLIRQWLQMQLQVSPRKLAKPGGWTLGRSFIRQPVVFLS
ncbi:hypothetical protein CCH79_00009827, partial [Gambusia affinis]